jgi:acyl carrier protein
MGDEDAILRRAAERQALCQRLKELIVDRLDLPVEPSWITDDQPLFGRGLGLDSVDALELVVAVEYELGVAVSDDDVGVFGSINRVADYIESRGLLDKGESSEPSAFIPG